MELADLIISSRAYLTRFDYDDYPPCFAEFEASAAPLFDALEGADPKQRAGVLLDALERRRSELSRREQKAALEQDKQVLALFLTPAANRRGSAAADFAAALCDAWCVRYPRSRYYPGDFEAIMKGFDANLLGLPLRKSRKKG